MQPLEQRAERDHAQSDAERLQLADDLRRVQHLRGERAVPVVRDDRILCDHCMRHDQLTDQVHQLIQATGADPRPFLAR